MGVNNIIFLEADPDLMEGMNATFNFTEDLSNINNRTYIVCPVCGVPEHYTNWAVRSKIGDGRTVPYLHCDCGGDTAYFLPVETMEYPYAIE